VNEAELAKAVKDGLTGAGTRVLSEGELRCLLDVALARKLLVSSMECWEIRDSSDIPRIDLGLFGPSRSGLHKPWIERVQISREDVEDVLRSVGRSTADSSLFRFKLWFDDGR
jgi:hypothetical protein